MCLHNSKRNILIYFDNTGLAKCFRAFPYDDEKFFRKNYGTEEVVSQNKLTK